MFFNSIDFAVFVPIVFLLYWFVFNKNLKLQNLLIVVSSYVFYGWWDYRFLSLMLFSTVVDYLVGRALSNEENFTKRKVLLWTSIIVNLGFLGFFKYFNFFIESFADAFSLFGLPIKANTLTIILPVGISFYTFQTLSYSIDVYKRRLEPTRDFIAFTAFVSFFPQLVAGPIERATHLLPQFYNKRKFEIEKAKEGIYQIIWGLVKKVVIADTCATYANTIFDNYDSMNSLSLMLGAVYFAFQIYGDFSGYSDIALGTSKLFGFNLMQNFSYPYFSRDIAEFWRRWHISLSTWFRDYLYIPLGGSQGGTWMKVRNTFIIFIVSGFWHGANWTFVIWGLLNAIYFLPLLLRNKNRMNIGAIELGFNINSARVFFNIILTFVLTCFAWIFFRAKNLAEAFGYIHRMFTEGQIKSQYLNIERHSVELLLLIAVFVSVEWLNRSRTEPLSGKGSWIKVALAIFALCALGVYSDYKQFIYFQF
jgi:alginate O-acetyltransferase complex protein AlgI